MSSSWTDWITRIATTRPLSAALVIGPGRGTELDGLERANLERLVLVEPDPDLARDLRRRVGHETSVIEAALADHSGRAIFHRFNLCSVSGLGERQGLNSVLPGLEELARFEVDAICPEDLLARLALPVVPDASERLLILDTPWATHHLADTARPTALADAFQHILFRSCKESIAAGALPVSDGIARLQEAGFELDEIDHQDPYFPAYCLRRSEQKRSWYTRLCELDDALEAARTETQSVWKAHAEAEARHTELENSLDTARADLTLALKTQAILRADLMELRERYAALLEEKDAQDAFFSSLITALDRKADESGSDTEDTEALSSGYIENFS